MPCITSNQLSDDHAMRLVLPNGADTTGRGAPWSTDTVLAGLMTLTCHGCLHACTDVPHCYTCCPQPAAASSGAARSADRGTWEGGQESVPQVEQSLSGVERLERNHWHHRVQVAVVEAMHASSLL
jgi:hypothetical protein